MVAVLIVGERAVSTHSRKQKDASGHNWAACILLFCTTGSLWGFEALTCHLGKPHLTC